MAPADALVLTLVALHVLEGLFWVHRHALVFAATTTSARLVNTDGPLGNTNHVFVILDPLPPLHPRFVVEAWPISVSESGVVRMPAELPIGTREAPAATAPFDYDALAEVTSSGKDVVTADRTVGNTSSVAFAHHLASRLRAIAKAANPADRTAAIDAMFAEAFDVDAARGRLLEFEKQTRFLNITSNLVPIVTIGGVAGILYVPWVANVWFSFAALAFGAYGLTWVEMFRAHRELYPELGGKRWQDLLLMIVSLPATARARGWIARDILAPYHPLTAAAVLLDADAFAEVARDTWRSLAHPLPVPAEARPIVEAMRARLRTHVAALLTARGLEPDTFAATPERSSERVVAVCPRCQSEFEQKQPECPDCPGVELVMPQV